MQPHARPQQQQRRPTVRGIAVHLFRAVAVTHFLGGGHLQPRSRHQHDRRVCAPRVAVCGGEGSAIARPQAHVQHDHVRRSHGPTQDLGRFPATLRHAHHVPVLLKRDAQTLSPLGA